MVRFLLKVLVVELIFVLAAAAWVVYDGMNDSHGSADCAVIFGETPTTGAEPDPVLQAQLDRAIELYREKVVSQVIVSSADASQGGDGSKVLSTMTRYLLAHGLPASGVLSDSKGTSLDAAAVDVATYQQQSGIQNVMIVVPYYEIMRTKLALWRAGVRPVLQVHVGKPGLPDAVPAARAIGDAGVRVFEDDLKPAALKLIARAQGQGQAVSDKITTASGAAQPSPAPDTNTATAPASAETDAPAAAASAASPAPAPLPDGQEVTATGIATFDVPRSWSERIVPPILDPVWAAPDIAGSPCRPTWSSRRPIRPARSRRPRTISRGRGRGSVLAASAWSPTTLSARRGGFRAFAW